MTDTWHPIDAAPQDGTPIVGAELYRFMPYKPDGQRQMRAKGRWQRWNGMGWSNSEPPLGWHPCDKLVVEDMAPEALDK